jgi:hypothetical protein
MGTGTGMGLDSLLVHDITLHVIRSISRETTPLLSDKSLSIGILGDRTPFIGDLDTIAVHDGVRGSQHSPHFSRH